MSKVVCKVFAGEFLLDDAPQLGRPDDIDGDQIETMKVKVLAAQWCLTLWDPMDCSPPGSSVHGILQARILEWVAIPFNSLPQGGNSILSDPGIKPGSPALQADCLPSRLPGKPQ